MCRILAVANVKGGVGKTTTAVNLSASLAERGRKVLAIDLDPQSSLTLSMGFDPETVKRTILNLIEKENEAVSSAILTTSEDWDIIPSNSDLRRLERILESEANHIYAVGTVIQKIRKRYDYILLDCPANAGILTGAALAAADQVVIPLTPDFLGFRVLGFLIRIIKEMQKDINPKLTIAGIFLTMYDSRTKHAREILTELHNKYASEIPLFSAIIHQTVRLKEAPSAGKSIIKYASKSQAAQAYRVIATEIEQGIPGGLVPFIAEMEQEAQPVLDVPVSDGEYASFTRESEMAPQSIGAWVGRAETAPPGDDAVRSLAKALKLDPKPEIRSDLEKRLDAHIHTSTKSDIQGLMKLGQFFIEEGFPNYGETTYRRVTDLDPKNETAWLARARSTDNSSEKIAFIQRCLEINPNNPAAHAEAAPAKREAKEEAAHLVERGTKLIQTGNMAEAHLLFKRAIQLDPTNDNAWLACARSAESLPAKLSFVKQALQINPKNRDARILHRSIASFMGVTDGDRPNSTPSSLRAISLGVTAALSIFISALLSALRLHY